MISTVICKLLDLQLNWLIQVGALKLFFIPTTMIQPLSNLLFKIYLLVNILFVYYVEELAIKMINAPFKFLISPSSLGKNMKQFNTLHGDKPSEPQRQCNSQPPSVHFKPHNSAPKHSPLVSEITERINHHSVDNGDVELYPSYYPL